MCTTQPTIYAYITQSEFIPLNEQHQLLYNAITCFGNPLNKSKPRRYLSAIFPQYPAAKIRAAKAGFRPESRQYSIGYGIWKSH